MKTLYKLYLLIVLSLISMALFAQRSDDDKKQNQLKPDEKFGFYFEGKKQKYVKIPFEFLSNLIIVKLRIDDSDTLRFVLDTGVSSTIITDQSLVKSIKQHYVRKIKLSGVGEEEPIIATVSVNHKLQMSDVIGNHQNIVLLDNDILKLSESLGVQVHGIFGHEIFNNFVVTINFEDKTLMLTLPEKFKYKKSYGERYPIVVTESKPYTDAIAFVKNDKDIPMRLIIDTGAGHALLLNTNETVALPDKVLRANLGRGLNGNIDGNIGRVAKIRMGTVEMNNIIASFPDSLSFSAKFPPQADKDMFRQGSIGCDLLRRFITTFNYKEGYIALKPIKSRINEAFEHDMSGLDIRAMGNKFNKFVINTVQDNSPAEKAGLRAGDEIVFFNKENALELTISEIFRGLSKKDGKEVTIFYRRDGQLKLATFRLKRMI